MQLLEVDEVDAARKKSVADQITNIMGSIITKYNLADSINPTVEVCNLLTVHARTLLASASTAASTTLLSETELKRLQVAFKATYRGTAHVDFHAYLIRCWIAYKTNPNNYLAPCTTLVQSSGFGKSRLLYEVAKMTADDLASAESSISMRVLYVCTRDEHKSSGYPLSTPGLADFIFVDGLTEVDLTTRLLDTWKYAQEHWDEVGKQWPDLFTVRRADASATAAIRKPSGALSKCCGNSQDRLLVVAVDEARSLLRKSDFNGDSCHRRVRRALKRASETLFQQNSRGGIFMVLVDTNSSVHNVFPSMKSGSSSRVIAPEAGMALIPAFVLTHTMDVFRQSLESATRSYRTNVTSDDPTEQWNALLSMGRPLWKSFIKPDTHVQFQHKAISDLAATKFLMGRPMNVGESYNKDTLYGVAALLCRLGLRPHPKTDLATRAMADFMSVLCYISYTNDSHITGYPSEPVLAFGAARLWYQVKSKSLEKHLLPAFEEMVMQRVVETGDIGEVAAHIFLLLAMDATTMRTHNGEGNSEQNFVFAGQFCSVRSFLDALTNSSSSDSLAKVKTLSLDDVVHDESRHFDAWMDQRENWKMSFVQFTDLLEEPTENMLWLLLGRRSAGVLRRDQKGSIVVIPIFFGQRVSYISVQVNNEFEVSNLLEGRTCALQDESLLSKVEPRDMIHINIHLRDKPTSKVPAQMYVDMTRIGTSNRDKNSSAASEPARKKTKVPTMVMDNAAG